MRSVSERTRVEARSADHPQSEGPQGRPWGPSASGRSALLREDGPANAEQNHRDQRPPEAVDDLRDAGAHKGLPRLEGPPAEVVRLQADVVLHFLQNKFRARALCGVSHAHLEHGPVAVCLLDLDRLEGLLRFVTPIVNGGVNGEEIVVAASQLLLSEEFRAQIQVEGDDD